MAKNKVIPLILILLGVAFLLGAILSWFDNLTASEPVGLGKWMFDILIALVGAGSGIKGWLDWNKKDTSTQVTKNIALGGAQISTGEQGRNIQTKDSSQYIEHYYEAPETESFKLRSLHQLPQPPADFTGRQNLLEGLLKDFEKQKGTIISGLTGMGGIGKTALGLVIANQLKEKCPDAQIFLDLKGTTTPLSAVDIARHVILSFEPTADLSRLDEKNLSAMYQSILQGKRVLLFFDNARSSEQITQFLPPNTCAMLITSRWTFAVAGLSLHRMGLMDIGDAKDFLLELSSRVGDRAADLAKACTYLPLALRIVGSFLQVNKDWSVDSYLIQLNDRKQRLATLSESRTEAELIIEPDLLITFELSYNQLSIDFQNQWLALGIFPGSFDWRAASAIWELEKDETTKSLGLLMRYSLLEYDENSAHYSMHDLLVDFALQRLNADDEENSRRLHSQYYQHILKTANNLYLQGDDGVTNGLKLLDEEFQNILLGRNWAADYANVNNFALRLTSEYPNSGYAILSLRLHPNEYMNWLQDGLQAAQMIKDKQSQGNHLGNLGNVYSSLGNTRKAIECYEQVLAITSELKDRMGEGSALGDLGGAYNDLGEFHKAIEFFEQELAIIQEMRESRGLVTTYGSLRGYLFAFREISPSY